MCTDSVPASGVLCCGSCVQRAAERGLETIAYWDNVVGGRDIHVYHACLILVLSRFAGKDYGGVSQYQQATSRPMHRHIIC